MAGVSSIKHIQLNKANQTVVFVVSGAIFITVFCLIVSWGILQRYNHQEAVITAKTEALDQIDQNIEAKNAIIQSYRVFTDPSSGENMLGGPIADEQDQRGGDNARLALDALPSVYDFPALVTSVNNLLENNSFSTSQIGGSDDELNQIDAAQGNPEVVEIPVSIGLEQLSYEDAERAVKLFERSIRPFNLQSIGISGGGGSLELRLEFLTYYKPAKKLEITEKVIQ